MTYVLRPTETRFNMWVCYEEGSSLSLRDDMMRLACSECGRVAPDAILAMESVAVSGFRPDFGLMTKTTDNYNVFGPNMLEALTECNVGGLLYVPIDGSNGSCLAFPKHLVHADISQMKEPKGRCSVCARPFSAVGRVGVVGVLDKFEIYGLAAEHFTGVSGYRHLLCNDDVASVLSSHGCESVLQDISTVAVFL